MVEQLRYQRHIQQHQWGTTCVGQPLAEVSRQYIAANLESMIARGELFKVYPGT
jgi:hypothetical protein